MADIEIADARAFGEPQGYSSGLLPIGGKLLYPVNVDELNPVLTWPHNLAIYEQMRWSDPLIVAIWNLLRSSMLKLNWHVDPADCENEKFVQLMANSLGLPVMGAETGTSPTAATVPYKAHLGQALEVFTFGFLPFEMTVEKEGDMYRLVSLELRHPRTILRPTTDGHGKLLEVWQAGLPQPIPGSRMCWYVVGELGDQKVGVSLLRGIYKPWVLKDRLERVGVLAIERNGMGIPHSHLPEAASEERQQRALALMKALRAGNDAALVTMGEDTVELLGVTGRLLDPLPLLEYLNYQEAVAFAMQFLMLGSTSTGARSLGEVQIDAADDTVQAYANMMADQFTEQVIKPLAEWSFGAGATYPRINPGMVGADGDIPIADLVNLINAGAITADGGLEKYLRERSNLPEMEDDSEHTGQSNEKPPMRPFPQHADEPGSAQLARADDPKASAPLRAGGATERRKEGADAAVATATIAAAHAHSIASAITGTYPDPRGIAQNAGEGFVPGAGAQQSSITDSIRMAQHPSGLDGLAAAIGAVYTSASHYGAGSAYGEVGGVPVSDGSQLQAIRDGIAERVSGIDTTTQERMANSLYADLTSGATVDEMAANLSGILGDTARASTIAQTEARFAYIAAKIDTWTQAGVSKFYWDAGSHCGVCSASQAASPVSSMGAWPSGPPPCHPNCSCDVFGTPPPTPGSAITSDS